MTRYFDRINRIHRYTNILIKLVFWTRINIKEVKLENSRYKKGGIRGDYFRGTVGLKI